MSPRSLLLFSASLRWISGLSLQLPNQITLQPDHVLRLAQRIARDYKAVFCALAECVDLRGVHVDAILNQYARDARQQARAIAGDEREIPCAAVLVRPQIDLRRDREAAHAPADAPFHGRRQRSVLLELQRGLVL